MSRCYDFANKKSAMEHLFVQLSRNAEETLKMLTSPKFHCELAGEGVKYVWGFMKRNFHNLSWTEKKEKFNKAVRSSVELVSVENVRMFADQCRRYTMTYQNFDKEDQQNMTFDMIEKYIQKLKTHCNISDFEKAWRDTISMLDDWRLLF